VTPDYQQKPLRLYARELAPLPPQGAAVTDLVTIANGRPPRAQPAPQSFVEVGRTTTASYVLVRYHAPTPVHIRASSGTLLQKGTQP
jgi:hypothetical protein